MDKLFCGHELNHMNQDKSFYINEIKYAFRTKLKEELVLQSQVFSSQSFCENRANQMKVSRPEIKETISFDVIQKGYKLMWRFKCE